MVSIVTRLQYSSTAVTGCNVKSDVINIMRPRDDSTRIKRSIPLVGFHSKSKTRYRMFYCLSYI